ncbi:MAG TPA: bifunctional glutamate N-acetyltransferase/amino-acid acetyltransferase ArgJ [Limnochordia bacterium]
MAQDLEGLEVVPGGVTAPRGFQAAGVHAGVKRKRLDLALIYSELEATAAGTFTRNRVKAAPLLLTMEHVARGRARAIVVNSGNANACNGPRGMVDARRMAEETAAALGIEPELVLVGSTGVIGQPLPIEKVIAGIRRAAKLLDRDGGTAAAEGIMTTDTRPKQIAVRFRLGGQAVTIGAIAKGSGMIHPNMATMMAFFTTDAAIECEQLREALRRAVNRTFNMITVDGDTSTNDMVLILANGAAHNRRIERGGDDFERFAAALEYAATHLAKEIVRDGEGATKLVEVRVRGARTEDDARKAAKAIANSNLVKTAIYGEDANWGRIFCAAGYSGAEFDPERVDIWIGELAVAKDGMALPFDEGKAKEILHEPEVTLTVDLRAGPHAATVWTCDLTYEYVKINASYRT